jgi:hypothetical protein
MDKDTALLLCDPGAPLDRSLATARQMMRSEPSLDVELAKLLPGREDGGATVSLNQSMRALEILDAISAGGRILMLISHLARHPEPRLRSKAAVIIGRRVRNITWIEKHLEEGDVRVQANIIESLWHEALPQCEAIFLRYRHSPNNRVAGNAVYGLCLRSHREARAALVAMAAHAESRFRGTAAWIIGKTAEAAFTDLLRPLLTDTDQRVRNAAFRALAKIRSKKLIKTAP